MTMNGLDVLGIDQGATVGTIPLRRRTVAALIGAAIGMLISRRHRVLGALGGLAIGRNGYGLVTKEISWQDAAESLVPHGAAIAGSLAYKPHPVWGYLGAGALAGIAVEAARGKLGERVREVVPSGLIRGKDGA